MNLQEEKIVVLDFDIPQLLNNKIFDPKETIKVSHTISPMCYLHAEAKKMGINFITPDVFLNLKYKPSKVLLMTHLITPWTEELIKNGAIPTILTCQESPFYASKFYLNLRKYSGWFKFSFVFFGMKRWLNAKSTYKQMFFPQSYVGMLWEPVNYCQKKLACMVSGARQSGNWGKNVLLKLLYGFKVKEINSERRKVIRFFGQKESFDLYGRGWLSMVFTDLSKDILKKCYKGTIDYGKKTQVISNYKFVFCFENAIFPGYVTEKIFDAMMAGSVPVYLGAPDISNFVPKDCFIDVRNFKSLLDLYVYLSNMKENTYNKFIQNIKEFFISKDYENFTQENFARNILEILEKEFINA